MLEFTSFVPGKTVYKYKRLIISNILPQIRNDIIVNKLKSLNITIRNGITNTRCSTSNKKRNHVLSYRRQFYVKEEDCDKVSNKINTHFNGIQYWIFLGAEVIKCHYCKLSGHIAKYWPKLNNDIIIILILLSCILKQKIRFQIILRI